MCSRGSFVQDYDEANPATHKGYDLRSMPMAALYKEYGLDPMTVDFIGHALALHRYAAGVRWSGRQATWVPSSCGSAWLHQGVWNRRLVMLSRRGDHR